MTDFNDPARAKLIQEGLLKDPIEFSNDQGAIAALNHAREMHRHAGGLRWRNFSFFLIIVAGLLAGRALLPVLVISLIGMVVSFAFFLLDNRQLRLILDTRADLYVIEPLFGLTIHNADRVKDPSRGVSEHSRRRLFSNTTGYRLIFGSTFLISLFTLLYEMF